MLVSPGCEEPKGLEESRRERECVQLLFKDSSSSVGFHGMQLDNSLQCPTKVKCVASAVVEFDLKS